MNLLLKKLANAFVYDAETGGAGSGTGGTTPATAPAGGGTIDVSQIQQGLQNLISRQGSSDAAALLLYQENHQYRQRIRELEADLKTTQGKLPKEGEVILSGKEVEAWKAYQALGDPEALKTLQGENEQIKGELGALRKEGTLRDVAEVAGYKVAVLKTLGAELDYEVKEVEKDGKKVKAVFVKNGDGQEAKPLADYAKEKWADFLPALQAEPPAGRPAGTPFPPQNPGSPPPAKPDLVTDFIKSANEARSSKTNPLVKREG